MSINPYPSICIICPQGCLKMEINVCIMATASMEQTPEPFVSRNTVQNIHCHPTRVCNCCGGWAWVVKIFVFFRVNVKPTCASEATSSSNKRHALSNVVQKKKSMSSANRKSNKGLRPSSRDNPSASIFARHEDKAISSTELNKRGLSTHPWRTPPRILNPQLSVSCSLTTPVCPKYTHCSIQIKCSEIPCCRSAGPFFFSCIAGLVRDLVGQQLEWACDWKQISPKKETNNQPNKTNNQNNTHTQAKARARQTSQGNLQTKWNQVKHTRPSQPLKCSRPPCSTPPRCPIVKCQPYQYLLLDTQASL